MSFAFSPPDISPATTYTLPRDYAPQQRPGSSSAHTAFVGAPSEHQPSNLNGYRRTSVGFEQLTNGGGRDEVERGSTTGGDGAARGASIQQSRGVSPGLQQQPTPPPFGGYSFNGQHMGHPGANIRNTRPMTAPSSVSAPYFHAALYSPHSAVPTSYYPGVQGFEAAHHPGYQSSPFQYQVDSGIAAVGNDHDSQRERGFSLPELVGIGPGAPSVDGGLPDDPRYSSGGSDGRGSPLSAGPFLYAPPPRATYYESSPQVNDPFGAGPSSRPTTAESSRPTSSHHARPLPLTAPPPSSVYQSRSSRAEIHRDGSVPQQPGESKVYNFVASAGQTTKRPRRRYDEIERLYTCDYPGCQKAYGTLNHLNSHKTMQKHGPKSTPARKVSREAQHFTTIADQLLCRRRVQGATKSLARQQEASSGGGSSHRCVRSADERVHIRRSPRHLPCSVYCSPSPVHVRWGVPLYRYCAVHGSTSSRHRSSPLRSSNARPSQWRIPRPLRRHSPRHGLHRANLLDAESDGPAAPPRSSLLHFLRPSPSLRQFVTASTSHCSKLLRRSSIRFGGVERRRRRSYDAHAHVFGRNGCAASEKDVATGRNQTADARVRIWRTWR